jgi:hypothetical protein
MQSSVEWLILVACKYSHCLPSMVLPVTISSILGILYIYISNFANCGIWFIVSVVATVMKCELAMGRAKWLQN